MDFLKSSAAVFSLATLFSISFIALITYSTTTAASPGLDDYTVTFEEQPGLDHVCFIITVDNPSDAELAAAPKFILNNTNVDIGKVTTKFWKETTEMRQVLHCSSCEVESCSEDNQTQEQTCNNVTVTGCSECGSWTEDVPRKAWEGKSLDVTEKTQLPEKKELKDTFESLSVAKSESEKYKLCYYFNDIPRNPQTGMPESYGYMYLDINGKLNFDFENSSWWNDSWLYSQTITLSGSRPENYSVPINLTDSNVGANFNFSSECFNSTDMRTRFVDANDNELDIALFSKTGETPCDSTNNISQIYLRVQDNTSDEITMYYGNPTAAAKNDIWTTFIFWEDFNDGVQAYTEHSCCGGDTIETSGELKHQGDSNWWGSNVILSNSDMNYPFFNNSDWGYEIIVDFRHPTNYPSNNGILYLADEGTTTWNDDNYAGPDGADLFHLSQTGTTFTAIFKFNWFKNATSPNFNQTTLAGSGTTDYTNDPDAREDIPRGLASLSGNMELILHGGNYQNNPTYWDWIMVRYLAYPEVGYSLGAEEELVLPPEITIYSPKNDTYDTATVNLLWSFDDPTYNEPDWAAYSFNGAANESLFFNDENYTKFNFKTYDETYHTTYYNYAPAGITTNGTYFWVTDDARDEVNRHSMTGEFIDRFTLPAEITNPLGITTNGTYLWITDSMDSHVYSFDMSGTSVGLNFSTSVYGGSHGITNNGTYFWIVDYADKYVYRYLMNGTYSGPAFNVSDEMDNPWGITQNGTYFWLTDVVDDKIYKYTMDGSYTGRSFSTTGENSDTRGITEDYPFLWVANNDISSQNDSVFKYAHAPTFSNVTLQANQGSNTVTVCANNTDGDMGCNTTTFFVDSIQPVLSINFPSNNTRYNLTWINITGTANDTNEVSVWINDTANFGTNLGNYTDWNFTNTSIEEGSYSLKITANDTAGNEVVAEVHFIIGVWNITFHIYSGEDGSNLTSVSVSCNNSWSDTINNGDTVGFTTGDYSCTFELWGYYNKTVDFTANKDTTIDVKMSEKDSLTIEEHDWLEAIYDCLHTGNCFALNLLLEINETTHKTWDQFKPTDWSTVNETVISDVVNSTTNITINYSINMPVKDGYGLIEGVQGYDDFLPIRLSYWFLDMDTKTQCYDQGSYDVAPVQPYCKPVVAYTVGQILTQANFTVEIQPDLPAGQYYIVRSIEIDPKNVWIDYGQEILGMVTVTEDSNHASASARSTDDTNLGEMIGDADEAGVSEATTSISSGEGDGMTGLLTGNIFDPSYVSVLVSMVTLLVVIFIYRDSRGKRSPWGH